MGSSNCFAMAVQESNTFVYNLSETIELQQRTMLYQPTECVDTCKQICCPWKPWADFSDGNDTFRYYNPCVCCPCGCNWTVAHAVSDSHFKDIGAIVPAGWCDNGFMWACCPCCVCDFKNLKAASIHTSAGRPGDFCVEPSNED